MSEVAAGQDNTDASAVASAADAPAPAEPAPADVVASPAPAESAPADPAPAEPAPGVPDSYDWTGMAMPDGMEFDKALAERAEPVLRELGLTQDQALKVAEVVMAQRVATNEEMAAQYADQMAQQQSDWIVAMKSDEEIGGTGGEQTDANIATAKKVVDAFAEEGFRDWLDQTGLGSHPEMIRLMLRVSQKLNLEEDIPGGGRPDAEPPPQLLRLYGDLNGTPRT